MKPFFSWLLVLFISLHCIGGYFCFQINYSVEIEREMDKVESKIAEALQDEMGTDVHVEIIYKDDFNLESFGYSGHFIFSKEMEGETYYYKINSSPLEIVNQQYTVYQHSHSEGNTDKGISFQRFFSKFTFEYFTPSIAAKCRKLPGNNFAYSGFHDIFQPSIPTPPPRWS